MKTPASAASSSGAAPARRPPVVEVRGLSAGYDERPILSDISFSVSAGETLAVVGASGCGKSTLVRCLVGLLRPLGGTVRLFGEDFWALGESGKNRVWRRIGMSFQGSALLNSLTVAENVALPLIEHTELDQETIAVMTRIKLEQVGLRGVEARLPSELSGGMRKRAGIARALAMDPKILFLDEPSAGLDPITAAGLDALMKSLRQALDLTLVVVTHELHSITEVADRVLMLDGGRVLIDGTLEQVASSHQPRVRQFFDRVPDPDRPSDSLASELTR